MKQIRINTIPIYSWLPYLLFFTLTFIYFAFFASYITFYQEKSSLFIFSIDFLKENLHQPGGPLIWLGKLFSTFFYYPAAGGFIIALMLSLIVLTVSAVIRTLSGNNFSLLPFLSGVALFYLQTDYRFMLFNSIGLLVNLTFFLLAIKTRTIFKGWLPVLLLPLIYFVTCGFTWFYLIMITFSYALEKDKKSWIKIAVTLCLCYLLFYISKEFLYFQSEKTLLTFPFTALNTGTQERLFIPLAIILSLLPLISKLRIKVPSRIRISGALISIGFYAFLGAVIIVTGILRFDKKTNQYFHVEKLFFNEKFDEVVAYNFFNPPTNSLTIFLNNIALCETNRLNDLLFNFPQDKDGKTLFLKWEMVGEILRRGGYFYYTIGMINEAHRWAFENMVMKGHNPEGLKMLIKTELISGNYNMASSYIDILKKTLFYKKEAGTFEKFLFNDSAIEADGELGEKRRTRLKSDFFSITDDPYINIERVLATDSLNKEAFEYKIAYSLLRKDYKAIEIELPAFSNFGYTRFPIHVEEAITALEVLKNGTPPSLGTIPLGINTRNRWIQYLTVLQNSGNDLKKAEPELRRQFGNTFWYWVFYK